MNRRSKILAGSSILAFLVAGGGGAALGLAYSGELFALLPVLSSVGMSIIGPALIGATALFLGVSLILSISFLRSRHLEKKNLKEKAVSEKKVKKEEDLVQEYVAIDPGELSKEQQKIRNFSDEEKEDYFKEAIQGFNQLAITAMVNEKENFKCFSVYYAASEGGNKVVKYIKILGVDLNEPEFGNYKRSPIYYAIESDDTKALKCLLDNEVNPITMKFREGRGIKDAVSSPLMVAAGGLHKESVALLLDVAEVQANINAVDYEGETALMFSFDKDSKDLSPAQKKVQYDIVKLLLDKGANPTIKNDDDETALSLARENNCDQSFISLLQKAEKEWKKKHKGKHADKVVKGKGSQVPHK